MTLILHKGSLLQLKGSVLQLRALFFWLKSFILCVKWFFFNSMALICSLFLTFLIHKKRLFISSEGFSTLEKNALICYQRVMLPIHLGVTAPCSNGSLAHFFFNSNFLGRVWQPSADNNGAPKGHYYLQRAVKPNQITQQNSLQRAGAP
jgi:hypothetical protein